MRHISALFDRKPSLDLVKEESQQLDFWLQTIRAEVVVDAHLDGLASCYEGLCHVHVPVIPEDDELHQRQPSQPAYLRPETGVPSGARH